VEPRKVNWFNEVRDTDGRIRPHYRSLYRQWRSIPAAKRKALQIGSKELFSGDYSLDPLPRLITGSEFAILKLGVEQRAKAIRAFLVDYYSGGRRWTKVMAPSILRAIVARNYSANYLGKLNPDSIAFPFGPDIIRNQQGRWRVVEDSAGMIGGIGDLLASRKIAMKLVPGYRRLLKDSNNPRDYFIELTRHFQSRAEQKKGIALVYLRRFEDEADHETRRLAGIFASLGVETCWQAHPFKRLLIQDDGIFLENRKKRTRVGYLVLYSGPEQTENSCLLRGIQSIRSSERNNFGSRLIHEWNRIIDGKTIASALVKGHAWSNFSPGVDFINDKMFGLHVDSFIRLYLKESPILESIPARSLAFRDRSGNWRLDREALRKVIRHKDRFVIKKADEDGGSGVWIGHRFPRRFFQNLRNVIHKTPEKFIYQEFEHLSVVENRIVDLRLHAQVDCEKIILSNNPWGRANWLSGDGKVNLGSNGFTSPVVVLK